MSIDHSHWAFEMTVRTPTSSVLLDRVKIACVPSSSRTNEWVARFLTTCHEGLLKFDFRHCKQIQLKQLLCFSSSLILVSNFSILTSKLRNLCIKPPLTGVAHGSLALASIPLSGSSFLLPNPWQSHFSFTRESLIPSRNLSQRPTLFIKENKANQNSDVQMVN